MSSNTTSKHTKPIFQPYIWTAILAVFMALILSQWAVADPPEQAELQSQEVAEEIVNSETEKIVEPIPEAKMVLAPKTEEPAPEMDMDAMHEKTQIMIVPQDGAKAPADKCYEQADGSLECVCEGETECEALKTAEHCEAGTHWGKDGFGGCTKKAPE